MYEYERTNTLYNTTNRYSTLQYMFDYTGQHNQIITNKQANAHGTIYTQIRAYVMRVEFMSYDSVYKYSSIYPNDAWVIQLCML